VGGAQIEESRMGDYTTVTWGELGCPTEPSNVDYDGLRLYIKRSHIQVANGEPAATFAILWFVGNKGVQYTLGARVD